MFESPLFRIVVIISSGNASLPLPEDIMEALVLCYMINITAKFKLEENLASVSFLTVRSEVVLISEKKNE